MKRTDIAMIIFIASISVLLSYFIANALVGEAKNEAVIVKTADSINAQVDQPDNRIFNSEAVNPTVEVYIGSEGGQP